MTDNRSWLLLRQNQPLTSHVGKFKDHQAAGTLKLKFWPKLSRKFFTVWPSQGKEIREWEILKDLVESGQLALPTCLGGSNDVAGQTAGLDIVVPDKEGSDGVTNEERQQPIPVNNKGSDLSSDEEKVRSANKAALQAAASGSTPTPEGAVPPKQPKKMKKKKPIEIVVPELLPTNADWMTKRNKV